MTEYPELPDEYPYGEPTAVRLAWLDAAEHELLLHILAYPNYDDPWGAKRQLTRHAYPGQAATRAEHVPPPCLCWYWTEAFGLRVSITDPQQRHIYDDCAADCSGFTINPACMHHGHLAHHDVIRRMWDDPYGYGLLRDPYDMDDDERKDH